MKVINIFFVRNYLLLLKYIYYFKSENLFLFMFYLLWNFLRAWSLSIIFFFNFSITNELAPINNFSLLSECRKLMSKFSFLPRPGWCGPLLRQVVGWLESEFNFPFREEVTIFLSLFSGRYYFVSCDIFRRLTKFSDSGNNFSKLDQIFLVWRYFQESK